MKHYNYLLLLPIAMLLTIVVSSCSGLTDEEKKFVGTWTSESFMDSLYDNNVRLIISQSDVYTYHEDKTYNQDEYGLLKWEYDFNDVTFRLYLYAHITYVSSWSADNKIYSDSTISTNCNNLISSNNEVAVLDKQTGKITRYGLYDKAFTETYIPEIVKTLQDDYKTMEELLKEEDHTKTIYKILSIGDNQIVFEDNNGERTTLKKGRMFSPRIQQMMQEGNALR